MAKKSKTQKAAAAARAQEIDRALPPLPPAGNFPFLRYTSAVGVHTSLLAFSALFLPRTTEVFEFLKPDIDPSQFTSKDRPQHPFLDALTLSPVSTVACICIGASVLQSWWGGWMRSWWIDFALDGSNLENRMDRAALEKHRFTNFLNAWLATVAGSIFLHAILILFGAPITSHVPETYSLALLISILTILPPAYTLGFPLASNTSTLLNRMTWTRVFAEFSTRTPVERAMLYPAIGAILGCWLGVIPIALDWDRPWQAWPLTPAFCAVVGYILASLAALTASATRHLADEHIRSLHTAKHKTD
ncbi:GPI biosynthesis protein family Pig-F-domain-containing protein [Mycena rebaudengoi]|nr:GPI biosynthesis protein family Pig-F-domain-containing protein [Mycena rebaudengoi]